MNAYAHRNMQVYQDAIAFVRWVSTDLRPALKKGNAHLGDQIARASSSIALNIAEGAGRFMRGEKRRFYLTALGSATECSAVLDIVAASELYDVKRSEYVHAERLLDGIVSALTRLARSMEE